MCCLKLSITDDAIHLNELNWYFHDKFYQGLYPSGIVQQHILRHITRHRTEECGSMHILSFDMLAFSVGRAICSNFACGQWISV